MDGSARDKMLHAFVLWTALCFVSAGFFGCAYVPPKRLDGYSTSVGTGPPKLPYPRSEGLIVTGEATLRGSIAADWLLTATRPRA
jgi:hypothetical protein